MMTPVPVEHQNKTYSQSTHWIVDARWYYAFLAFFLGIISREDIGVSFAPSLLTISFFAILIFNGVLLYLIRRHGIDNYSQQKIQTLNLCQVAVDLTYFFIIILITGAGADGIAHSFFFIPIIVSMVLFGFRGAIAVALASGLLIFVAVLAHVGALTLLITPGMSFVITPEISLALMKSGVIFLVYLLVGFFGGYISRLIRAHDLLLLEQIKKEEGHVARLRELTKEFDKSAKLLVRRDLELTMANDKLTQLDKMKSDIVSIVAHQLRTPLSAIKWMLKVLLDEDAGALTQEQKTLLRRGFESNERMITLINDMLSADHLESGKIKYTFIPVQLEELVHDVKQDLLEFATQKNIRIDFIVPSTVLPKIHIDPEKMREVFQNLIDNAIKYSAKDSTVIIGIDASPEEIHVWVKDTGIGIPSGEGEKIFSRFFRATNAIKTTDGSGLGLFIASSIVKRHGGRIWYESVENQGATFHVALPLIL